MPNVTRFAVIAMTALMLATAHASPSTQEAANALSDFMRSAADEGFTGGVAVSRKGEILLHAGFGERVPGTRDPVKADTVSTVGSITKQFTAAAVLTLQEAKKLSVNDTLAQWFDHVPVDKQGITIHQLLSHSAGFAPAIGPDNERIGRDDFIEQALDSELLFEPGSGYEYSNVGFSLAAAIVELASGMEYEQYLYEHLFKPAQMQETGYVMPSWPQNRIAHGREHDGSDWGTVLKFAVGQDGPGWHLVGNGGIHSTPMDMVRWHRALQSDKILSAQSKDMLYGRHVEEPGGTWYGYGWSTEPTPWGDMVAHNGGNPYYFADYLRFLDDDVVIYYWTTSRERRFNDLARSLAQIVFSAEAPPLPPAQAPLIVAGDHESDHALANKWRLPGSVEGRRGAEFLEAMVLASGPERRRLVADLFSESLIEKRGIDGALEVLDTLKAEAGDFVVQGIRIRPDGVDVVLDMVQGQMSLILLLDQTDARKVGGIGVEIGG